jgi:MoaA/NifB/PqqE/SkfB family radical SAM enzyme
VDKLRLVKQNRLHFIAQSRLKVRAGPSGVHIFNRATGLNVLLEEVKVPSAMWAAAPRQISIALTNACDLACPYCFAPKNPATLDIERVIGWLDELDINGCLSVGFGGGEPTLYRHFVEVCRYATMKTGLAVTFTTHAHHLGEKLISALTGNVHFVRVSMDGVGATYEALRGRPFAAFLKHLESLRSLAPFGINFVVNSRTLPELDAATRLASELGASEFLLLPEQPSRGSCGIDDRTAQALRRWVSQYRGAIPLTVSETSADGLPTCNPLVRETKLRAYAHIDASGILKRSSYDSHGVVIGADGVIPALNLLRTRQEE